ncbi:MAG: hypothetical protein JWR85_2987 [Marmoricola sp.]|nr:hypothetical protein [Marmoricola sp.]
MAGDFDYDVALSFAGEQRDYVEKVAASLRAGGIRVFYDKYEKADLLGKDLYEHLDYIYRRAARYCVVFASAEYAEKMWTTDERRSAQARAIEENAEHVLPARFDSTEIPGIRSTVGHIDLNEHSPEELSELIVEKLGPQQREKFFPPVPDRLFEALEVAPDEEPYAEELAREYYRALSRMTGAERALLLDLFWEGCPSKLPDNVHVSLDLMRRATGMPTAEIRDTLRGLSSLGVEVRDYQSDEHEDEDMIEIQWENRIEYDDPDQDAFSLERATDVARAVMLGASAEMCRECATGAIARLDFAELSSVVEPKSHA